jgi:hypothetical protein
MQGKVTLKVFPPTGRDFYLLSFDPEAGEARYQKVTACVGDQRETVEETWLSNVFDVLNTKGVAVRVEWSGPKNASP